MQSCNPSGNVFFEHSPNMVETSKVSQPLLKKNFLLTHWPTFFDFGEVNMKTHEVCTTNKHIPYCGQSLCQQPKPVGFFTMEETPEMVEGAFYFFQPQKPTLLFRFLKSWRKPYSSPKETFHLYTLWRFYPEKINGRKDPFRSWFRGVFPKIILKGPHLFGRLIFG